MVGSSPSSQASNDAGSVFVSEEHLQQLMAQADTLIAEAQQKAQQVILEANVQAGEIIEAANNQARDILEDANKHGFEEGYRLGYESGYTEINDKLSAQVKGIEKLSNAAFEIKQQVIASAEPEILELSVSIAEKIIREKLDLEPQIVLNIIRSAISALKDKEEVKILINPQLAEIVYGFTDELTQCIKGIKSIKVVEDRTVSPDGAIVESPDSRIDARLQTQIEEITRILMREAVENPSITEETVSTVQVTVIKPDDDE